MPSRSNLSEYLHLCFAVIDCIAFFEMFLFVYLSLLLLLLPLFSLIFISGKNLISSSKDAAATTAVVEPIISTISVSLLLTLKIVHYSWEFPVFRPATLNNQLNQIPMRRIHLKLAIKTPA